MAIDYLVVILVTWSLGLCLGACVVLTWVIARMQRLVEDMAGEVRMGRIATQDPQAGRIQSKDHADRQKAQGVIDQIMAKKLRATQQRDKQGDVEKGRVRQKTTVKPSDM